MLIAQWNTMLAIPPYSHTAAHSGMLSPVQTDRPLQQRTQCLHTKCFDKPGLPVACTTFAWWLTTSTICTNIFIFPAAYHLWDISWTVSGNPPPKSPTTPDERSLICTIVVQIIKGVYL